MKILVLNCGSSSIKYQLIDMPSQDVLAKGLIEKIGLKDSLIIHKRCDGKETCVEGEIPDHTLGISKLLEILMSAEYGSIKTTMKFLLWDIVLFTAVKSSVQVFC